MLNLVVIRSPDIDASAKFFSAFGLTFEKHSHGKGPEHYASDSDGTVFEIYPQAEDSTSATRLGFSVADIDQTLKLTEELGAKTLSQPKDSPWGRRAVIQEPFGHRIELIQKT